MTNLQKRIAKLLMQTGIGCELKGYSFLKTAIELTYNDSTYMDTVTKRLYPKIAKIHETTPARAERAMRHYIASALDASENGLVDILGQPATSRPLYNSKFISACVEMIRIKEKEVETYD